MGRNGKAPLQSNGNPLHHDFDEIFPASFNSLSGSNYSPEAIYSGHV